MKQDIDPLLLSLVERVHEAAANGTPLQIRGGGTKAFHGGAPQGEPLDVTRLRGVVSHEPTELVVTARCGTPLAELEAALADKGQCLPFEPPHLGADATVGGMVAAGLSGPSRAAVGAVRDYVLGATLLNGRGDVMSFGGQVMKNVAGYDVSRLLAGSMGTLGVILEVSLKVLPVAPAEATLRFEMKEATALRTLNEWAGRPLPLNASAWWKGTLVLRLRGAQAAVASAVAQLGGETLGPAQAAPLWLSLREQRHAFFTGAMSAVNAGAALWRLSLPQTAPPLQLPGEQLIEWGGAQRWLCTGMPADAVREAARALGGHATLWHARDRAAGVFTPLSPVLARIHRELKRAFDPAGIFNPGRLGPDL
ncbi:glycolate oxidase subunit GlcE [Caldimonas tepidiphila]|uniref:glycolate oxidase subunit GlcE n=1 Tax=Caldimonas tepidiphila TaxID=2315841 RepID=UPI000E5B018F|nr:glycolate oxidase subunit GlcE [Caldimonas tepidiphila]